MLDNNTDLPGRQRFKTAFNSFIKMNQNANINNMFTVDSVLIFRIGECKLNEVIYSKGHPTNPAQGSWSIINENQYLKIILHETNGVNSLVFKSNTQILNTDRRITIGINFFDATSNLELFVNSIPVLFTLDVSQGHYRTNINQFTGLRVTSDDVLVGRGTGLIFGEFGLYYDACETRVLTQSEHNVYYVPLIDARPIVTQGKIIFISDRDGNNNVYEMNEDGTNQAYKVGVGNPESYPNYANNSDGFTYGLNAGLWYGKYIKDDNTVFTIPDLYVSTGGKSQINSTGTDIYYTRDGGMLYKYTLSGGAINNLDLTTAGINWGSWNQHFNDLNPTNDNLILFNRARSSNNHYLYTRNMSTHVETLIFTLPYVSGTSDPRFINAKFSPDGTKIAFDMYFTDNGNDFRIYTCNSDGTNLQLIQMSNFNVNPIFFNSWSPDGTKLLLNKKFTGVGYTDKSQLFTRDLTTNAEVLLTAHNSNNTVGDWKA